MASLKKFKNLLSTASPMPLYHQLYVVLRDKIMNGEFPHDTQLPTELQLADGFAVSRITAKRALDELAKANLVRRRRGSGTHVTYRAEASVMRAPLVGLLENLEVLAEKSEVSVIEFARTAAPQRISHEFGAAVDTIYAYAVRVRSEGGIPFAHYVSWSDVPQSEFNADNLKKSSRLALFKRCGISFERVEQSLSAVLADASVAPRLKVEIGQPLLALERRSFDRKGKLVDLLYGLYRPDRFRYQMTMSVNGKERKR